MPAPSTTVEAAITAAPGASTEIVEVATNEPTTVAETATTEYTPEATTEAAAEATDETAVAEPEVSSCPDGLRLFDHELLASAPVCIPDAPQRVIALDMAALEMLLLKDQLPVGTATWILEELPLLLPQFAEKLSTIDGLGYPAELETVAVLKPDLIPATEDTIDVELAGDIAPMVIPDLVIYNDWKLGMQFWSAVLNIPDRYKRNHTGSFGRTIGNTRGGGISTAPSTACSIL